MPSIPVDTRRAHWTDPRGRRGTFVPNRSAPLYAHGVAPNPRERYKRGTLAARLFVGLSVGTKPAWRVEDVVAIVQRVRDQQTGGRFGASFLLQRGLYTAADGTRVDEDSVQVVMIDEDGLTIDNWTAQIEAVAEALVGDLSQDVVIMEIQKSGVVRDTYGVSAP